MNIFRDCLKKDWEKDIVSPLLVNLSTAFILFLFSLIFAPIRNFLFPKTEIKEYPLFCTAEAYIKQPDNELIVEFFIINRTGEDLTRQRLIELLQDYNPDPNTPVSPDIELKFRDNDEGQLGKPYLEKEFNDKKGNVRLNLNRQLNVVNIIIDNIVERAIIKVSIPITDVPELEKKIIGRTTKVAIPFNFRDYEEGCYKRL